MEQFIDFLQFVGAVAFIVWVPFAKNISRWVDYLYDPSGVY